MKCHAIVVLSVVAALVVATPATGQPGWVVEESGFDSGFQGWTFTSGLIWSPGGGNPGGFLRFEDDGPADGGIIAAPARYLGDWSDLDGMGVLRYDYIIIDVSGPQFPMGRIDISGPGGSARWHPPVEPGPYLWRTRMIPIEEAAWSIRSGSWDALLENVTRFTISMAASSVTSETTGVDNVQLLFECGADIDGDSELTIFDFLAFQGLFALGDLQADFDGDGSLTLFDFLAFQNAFDAGCP